MLKRSWLLLIAAVLLAVILMAYPFMVRGYYVRFVTMLFIYMALAQAWNILGGFAGYISLGMTGLVGAGAYTAGIFMTRFDYPYYIAILLGGVLAGLLALITGVPVLRLKAGYFAIATFALGYILREIANNLNWLTGGGMGLSLPIRPGGINANNTFFYFLMFFFAIAATLVNYFISKSRLGYGLMAIKEDEEAASVLGVNTTVYKVIAFVLSCFIAGTVGGAYAYYLSFIEPISAFDPNISILVIIMTLIGGGGTFAGPVLGATIVTLLSELLWNRFLELHQGFLGIMLILIVLFIPRGVIELFKTEGKPSFSIVMGKLKNNIRSYRV